MNVYCAKVISETEDSHKEGFVIENLMVTAKNFTDAVSKIEDFYRNALITIKELTEVSHGVPKQMIWLHSTMNYHVL